MMAKRATSIKIVGIRRRQLPAGALPNTVALTPDSTITSTMKPNTVAAMRTPVASTEMAVVLITSSSSAPSGTT